MKKILITGAFGNVGKVVSQGLQLQNYYLCCADINMPDNIFDRVKDPINTANLEFLKLDILDLEHLKAAMCNIDCVIHLAGIPQDDAWDRLEEINIRGTYNIFEAARIQKVPRVIFASTNQVIGFYRTHKKVDTYVPPRPASFYGVTKIFGETLGRLYAHKFGIKVACIRIGSFQDKPSEKRHLSTWVSHRDLVHLTVRCIEADYHHIIIYGVSANTQSMWENNTAKEIGYYPKDNAEDYANDSALIEMRDEIGQQFQGGQFSAAEFCGEPAEID